MKLNNTVYIYKYDTLQVTKQQCNRMTIGNTYMRYVINILLIKKKVITIVMTFMKIALASDPAYIFDLVDMQIYLR